MGREVGWMPQGGWQSWAGLNPKGRMEIYRSRAWQRHSLCGPPIFAWVSRSVSQVTEPDLRNSGVSGEGSEALKQGVPSGPSWAGGHGRGLHEPCDQTLVTVGTARPESGLECWGRALGHLLLCAVVCPFTRPAWGCPWGHTTGRVTSALLPSCC